MMRRLACGALLAVVAGSPLVAQPSTIAAPLSAAGSALVGRLLLAEDRRDSLDIALRDGARHGDARIRTLAWRAQRRIRDPQFAARDSLPPLPAPPAWPEPAWRLRYRALSAQRDDCGAMRVALVDSAWPVRLRAASLVRESCAADGLIVETLRAWMDSLPADGNRRVAGSPSWHAAAHGLVALARLRPDDASRRIGRVASHPQWQARMYAARAAATLGEGHAERLRVLARDRNDNVKEAAIDALSKLTGHADDAVYIAALEADGAQAVRAAAIALKGSPNPNARTAAAAALERWTARANASTRDARLALLEAAGLPAAADRPPSQAPRLPPRAVALALGEDVRLRVTMSPASGGGAFVVRLRGDVAPMMAARVLELARSGYYDNTGWHRAEHDFVVQGLGPGDNEYVGHDTYFRDELGTVPHARGTIGMSTRGHDTGDAQWFVNLKDNLRLGRDYTVFAEIVEGMDVVDGIMEGDVVATIREVPPGRLIDVGGRTMHLLCEGARAAGTPLVVFEAGASSFAIDFTLVQREVARTHRACAYDRAGMGRSAGASARLNGAARGWGRLRAV